MIVISFGAALGAAGVTFTGIFQVGEAISAVPLFGFIFLAILGIDRSIFRMTRVRDESLVYSTRQGVLKGLTLAGGVIIFAGTVLVPRLSYDMRRAIWWRAKLAGNPETEVGAR